MQSSICSPEILLARTFSPDNQNKSLIVITGASGLGKSSWCQKLARAAQARGLKVGGLLAPPVFQNGQKIAIDLVDLLSGERHPLAVRRNLSVSDSRPATGDWLFDPQVLAWGDSLLAQMDPLELFILDEAGPLEFENSQGFVSGLLRIDARRDRLAVATLRPGLLSKAGERWPWVQVCTAENWRESWEETV